MKKIFLFVGLLSIGTSLFASNYTGSTQSNSYLLYCDSHEACSHNDDLKIEARGIACDCGGNMTSSKTYSSWNHSSTKVCSHGAVNKVHKVYARIVITTWKCGDCGRSHITSSIETKEECVRI